MFGVASNYWHFKMLKSTQNAIPTDYFLFIVAAKRTHMTEHTR